MDTSTTKRNAPGQGGVFGKTKTKHSGRNYLTICGPAQVYEMLKAEFLASHRECSA